jgi:CheY-specific phosphatase CheX
MIAEEMTARLSEAAYCVLDMMYSVPVLRDEEFPPPDSVDPFLIGLDFRGDFKGRFAMAVDQPAAAEIATAFIGSGQTIATPQIVEVLLELANMLCGSLLSQLNLAESFELTTPVQLDPAKITEDNLARPGESYQRTVHTASGTLTMNIVMEAPNPCVPS